MTSQRLLISILVLVAAGALAFWLLHPKSATAPTSTIETSGSANANTPLTNAPHLPAELLGIGKARDERRLADLQTIQAALEAFKIASAESLYPTDLAQLVPVQLGAVPKDPLTGQEYDYTPIGTGPNFYELMYTLEVGAQGIASGQHAATPNGVATP